MRRRAAGLLALLALVLVVSSCTFDGAYDLPLPGGKAVDEDDAITVVATFTDALNVVPRTAVMVDDVPVGQVSEVERDGWNARITMLIRDDLTLPANATAEIRQTSLLGEKYVAILDPVGVEPEGRLTDGAEIGLDSTGRNPEVEEVLGALSFVLSGGGIQQLRTISTELNTMMSGRTSTMRDVLRRIDTLVGTLDGQRGDIVAAMEGINRLSATLNEERETIGSAIDAIGPALAALNRQHDALMTLLTELDKLGDVGTRVIRASRDDLVATLKHLEPALRELADAGMSLPRGVGLMASFPFPKEAANLAKGDYANALFNIEFDLDKLFGIGGVGDTSGLPSPLEICMATPAAPLCQTLDESLIQQLCQLAPANPLCPGVGPSSGEPDGGLGVIEQGLGGLQSPGRAVTAAPDARSTLDRLVSSLSLLLGGDRR